MSGGPALSPGRKALLVAVGFLVTLAVAALFLSLAPPAPDPVPPQSTPLPTIPTPAAGPDVPAEERAPATPTAVPPRAAEPETAPPSPTPAPTAAPPPLEADPAAIATGSTSPPSVVRALILEFDTRTYAARFLAHARATADPGVVLLMEATPAGRWGVWIEGTDEGRVLGQLHELRAELGLAEPPAGRQEDEEIEP